ncbi:MAG: S8 family serine peptidase, partial [Verrucomicrobiota bacterium]
QHHAIHRSNVRVVGVPEASAASILAELQRDPTIEFAERDYLAEAAFVPNDPYVVAGSEWHLERIQAPQAWNISFGSSNVVVAVLDSGINAAHPDLSDQTLPGYDFVWGDNDPADDFGHGTAVAGVIAAAGNNFIGVAGVAFGSKILPVKVMDASGFAAYSTLAQGIRYAVDQGARVINLSLAGSASSSTLQDAINYAWSNNVVIVAAAGNNGNSTPQYPAACEHVVAVSATEPDDTLASFSSTGNHLALAAPGDNIFTTARDLANPYSAWSGTSFASPIIAAVAALIASANALLDNSQIVSVLEQTADDLGVVGPDASFGYGRVNAARAVSVASGIPIDTNPPPPPIPPTVNIATPTNNSQIVLGASATVTVSAVAGSTNSAITSVQLFANGLALATFSAPPFSVNWKATTTGSYLLTAVATADSGLSSTSAPVVVQILTNPGPVFATLSLQTNGLGSVKPNLNGKQLVVSRTYTVTARPGAGQVFAGWEGIASTSPTLSFMMQPGLALVAKFVPTPFNPVKGNYSGLVWNTNGVTPDSSGTFTLTVTTSGAFSSRVTVGGKRYSLRGLFDINGDATVTIPRSLSSPLAVSLRVDLGNGTDEVYGTINDSGWVAALAGDRRVFNSQVNPAPQAGQRAFLLERAESIASTAATGLSKIATTGRASVGGALNDGRKFSVANTLAKNGDYPFYLSLSKGSEVMIGWLNFPAGSSNAAAGT